MAKIVTSHNAKILADFRNKTKIQNEHLCNCQEELTTVVKMASVYPNQLCKKSMLTVSDGEVTGSQNIHKTKSKFKDRLYEQNTD